MAAVTWEKLPTEKKEAIKAAAKDIGIGYNWLAAILEFESGFWEKAQSPDKQAVGMLQWRPIGAATHGLTIEEIYSYSWPKQLELVVDWFQRRKSYADLPSAYMAVLWPAAVDADINETLFSRGSNQYAGNKALDRNKDGDVTKAEASSFVVAKNLRIANYEAGQIDWSKAGNGEDASANAFILSMGLGVAFWVLLKASEVK